MSKRFYLFNHYLMLASLGLLVLWIVVGFVLLPFMKFFSYDFVCLVCKIDGWAYPILFSLFCIGSGVVVHGFAEHRMKREEEK